MPPKKAAGPSKKTIEKAKTKIVEDKTFGLKNKNKSAKVQQYVQQVEKQASTLGKTKADLKKEATTVPKKSKAEVEREKKEELAKLLGIVQPKLEVGVDPKSVLCEYHRMGCCAKGDKCKYSHDLNVARKSEKIDLYTDRHEANKDSMAGWNQDELESVIEKRHGSTNKGLPPTTIVCKYFLDAVEQKRYGWFWSCPNGPTCHYRHCLPPGFVLKSEKKVEEVNPEDLLSLEDQIEQERALLETRTPVTHESFLAWKKKKAEERAKKEAEAEAERKKEIKSGKTVMSGREMFTFNPNLFVDEEGAGDADDYEREEDPDVQERIITVTGTSIGHRLKGEAESEAGSADADSHADDADSSSSLPAPDPNVCPQCSRRMKGGAEAVRDHLVGKHQLSMEAAVAEVDRIAALVAAASASAAAAAAAEAADVPSAAAAAADDSASSAAAADASEPANVDVDEDLFDVDDDDVDD